MRPVRIVDCDIHWKPRDTEELIEYLPDPWRSRSSVRHMLEAPIIYGPYAYANREDARPETGGPPCSDPALVADQLLAGGGVDIAINIPTGRPFTPVPDPALNAAVARATNEWQSATVLGAYNAHGRYRGSLAIPLNDVAAAVGEIERWAGHPYFVQVHLPHYSGAPYGSPEFRPVWEAAARHGLPVAIHQARSQSDPFLTPVGHLQRYPEYNGIGYPLAYAAHLVSWFAAGVFSTLPDFRAVFVEGGFSWSGPLITRLDRSWAALRDDAPALDRLPSSLLRDHVRFSSQPVEEPEDPADLAALYDWSRAGDLLMFSSDYPHWDYDHPARALPRVLAPELRRRILAGNAIEFYGLPAERPVDEHDSVP